MQAETSVTLTLKSRPLFPFPQAVTLGAAIVAAAVFVSAQYGHWTPSHQDNAAPAQTFTPPSHPFGALIPISPDAPSSPARTPQAAAPKSLATSPWAAVTQGLLNEIDARRNRPEPSPEPQIAQRETGAEVPLPPRRPQTDFTTARPEAPAVAAAPAPDNRGLFERLFNIQPSERTALAYATPQDGAVSGALRGANQMPMGYADGHTAVYDISAKAVIMPNGEKLEAHSGLGPLLDNPNHVHVKNRGATPPNVYELSLREQLFHGVRAIRLNPVNANDMFGRDGMLAHTYMLGPNGDSNGCVSFKDYDRFLRAFLNGEVKRLVVVQRMA